MRKSSLLARLMVQMAIPIVILGAAIAFIGVSFTSIINELAKTFEEESFKSISLVLNADRDFYQALDGYNKILIYPKGSEEYNASMETYKSNIVDVEQRMGTIRQLANENADMGSLTLTDAQGTVILTLDVFFKELDKWKAATQNIVDKVESGVSSEDLIQEINDASVLFDEARDKLNTIGEELELYPAILSQKYLSSTKNTMLITYLVTVVIALIPIAYYVLSIMKISKKISGIAMEQNGLANGLQKASFKLSDSSIQLSEGANEQAASIEETSATMDETSSMVRQNAENTSQANALSKQTIEAAHAGSEKMKEMIDSMDELKKSSGEISKIIKVIDEIAFQTNMLALNAAVEAARAGDAGQGFAVVAEEVRNLAQKSANAAKDTAEIIDRNIVLSDKGAGLSEDVNVSLKEIMDKAQNVNQLMEEISAASEEQARGTAQVTDAISQMEQVVQKNASMAEQSADSADVLLTQSGALGDSVKELIQLTKGSKAKDEELSKSADTNKTPQLLRGNKTPQKQIVAPDDVIPLDKADDF